MKWHISKQKLFCFLVLLYSCFLNARDIGITFDNHGDFITPDNYYLSQGLKYNKKNKKEAAINNLKKSAQFGNDYARFLIASMLMEKQQWHQAYNWLQLTDGENIEREEKITQLLNSIEKAFSPKQLKLAHESFIELNKLYGNESAFAHRKQWANNLSFSGSNIKGRIPYSITTITNKEPRKIITEIELRRYIDDFIHDYSSQIPSSLRPQILKKLNQLTKI